MRSVGVLGKKGQVALEKPLLVQCLIPGGAGKKVNMAAKATQKVAVKPLKVVVHEAEEGGYWAEVPSLPGCATQGDSLDELLLNIRNAVEGCQSVRA